MKKNTFLSIALEVARSAQKAVLKESDLGAKIGSVGVGGDETKHGDMVVEKALRKTIPKVLSKYKIPAALVISEEMGFWKIGNTAAAKSIFLIIDPIDGSRNLRPEPTPRPFVACSVAAGRMSDIESDGTLNAVQAGVVIDIFHKETYVATQKGGAYLLEDNFKLKAAKTKELCDVTLGASIDKTGKDMEKIFQDGLIKLLTTTQFHRRLGLTTLDVLRVGSGDYDAHISMSGGVKIHDIAAAQLIVKEAGGTIAFFSNGKDITNSKLLKNLVDLGDEGIKKISFKLLAAGTPELLQKIKSIVKV